MRNTTITRIINFVRNIGPKVWLSISLGATVALGLWVLLNAFTAAVNLLHEIDDERKAQQEVYTEAIEEVKRNCDLVEKIIRQKSATYTYLCDGVEYQFEEWL